MNSLGNSSANSAPHLASTSERFTQDIFTATAWERQSPELPKAGILCPSTLWRNAGVLLDVRYPCSGRASPAIRDQLSDRVQRAACEHFNRTVGAITHPTVQSEDVCLPIHPMPISNPLYATCNDETNRFKAKHNGVYILMHALM